LDIPSNLSRALFCLRFSGHNALSSPKNASWQE
jgi:hypothetical protein